METDLYYGRFMRMYIDGRSNVFDIARCGCRFFPSGILLIPERIRPFSTSFSFTSLFTSFALSLLDDDVGILSLAAGVVLISDNYYDYCQSKVWLKFCSE